MFIHKWFQCIILSKGNPHDRDINCTKWQSITLPRYLTTQLFSSRYIWQHISLSALIPIYFDSSSLLNALPMNLVIQHCVRDLISNQSRFHQCRVYHLTMIVQCILTELNMQVCIGPHIFCQCLQSLRHRMSRPPPSIAGGVPQGVPTAYSVDLHTPHTCKLHYHLLLM